MLSLTHVKPFGPHVKSSEMAQDFFSLIVPSHSFKWYKTSDRWDYYWSVCTHKTLKTLIKWASDWLKQQYVRCKQWRLGPACTLCRLIRVFCVCMLTLWTTKHQRVNSKPRLQRCQDGKEGVQVVLNGTLSNLDWNSASVLCQFQLTCCNLYQVSKKSNFTMFTPAS